MFLRQDNRTNNDDASKKETAAVQKVLDNSKELVEMAKYAATSNYNITSTVTESNGRITRTVTNFHVDMVKKIKESTTFKELLNALYYFDLDNTELTKSIGKTGANAALYLYSFVRAEGNFVLQGKNLRESCLLEAAKWNLENHSDNNFTNTTSIPKNN